MVAFYYKLHGIRSLFMLNRHSLGIHASRNRVICDGDQPILIISDNLCFFFFDHWTCLGESHLKRTTAKPHNVFVYVKGRSRSFPIIYILFQPWKCIRCLSRVTGHRIQGNSTFPSWTGEFREKKTADTGMYSENNDKEWVQLTRLTFWNVSTSYSFWNPSLISTLLHQICDWNLWVHSWICPQISFIDV